MDARTAGSQSFQESFCLVQRDLAPIGAGMACAALLELPEAGAVTAAVERSLEPAVVAPLSEDPQLVRAHLSTERTLAVADAHDGRRRGDARDQLAREEGSACPRALGDDDQVRVLQRPDELGFLQEPAHDEASIAPRLDPRAQRRALRSVAVDPELHLGARARQPLAEVEQSLLLADVARVQ